MDAKGIKVLSVTPVYNKYTATLYSEFIDEIVTKLHHIGIDFITPPKDCFYSKELFFDTVYHLNKSGIDKNDTFIKKAKKGYKIKLPLGYIFLGVILLK